MQPLQHSPAAPSSRPRLALPRTPPTPLALPAIMPALTLAMSPSPAACLPQTHTGIVVSASVSDHGSGNEAPEGGLPPGIGSLSWQRRVAGSSSSSAFFQGASLRHSAAAARAVCGGGRERERSEAPKARFAHTLPEVRVKRYRMWHP